MLAAQHVARLVSHAVVISTGILLAALGLGIEALTAPVLFYLITSVLTIGTFFMLTGMTDRTRENLSAATPSPAPTPQAPFYEAFGVAEPDPYGTDEDVGVALPRVDHVSRAHLRELRAARYGPAAAAGLRRQVRAVVDGDRRRARRGILGATRGRSRSRCSRRGLPASSR